MGDQVLGRGLSGTAGDRDNGQRLAAQAIGGDVEQGLARVRDQDHGGVVDRLRRPLTEDTGGATLDRLGNEAMAVLLLATQGDEEATGLHLARIDEQRAQ